MKKKKILATLLVIFIIVLFLNIFLISPKHVSSSNVREGSCCPNSVAICNAGGEDHKGYEYSAGGCNVEK